MCGPDHVIANTLTRLDVLLITAGPLQSRRRFHSRCTVDNDVHCRKTIETVAITRFWRGPYMVYNEIAILAPAYSVEPD